MGTGASIIDIADDVQALDGQMLDQLGQMDDEILCNACRDDGVDLAFVIGGFVFDPFLIVKQFLKGFCHRLWQKVANCFAPVLGAELAAKLDEANQR